MTVLPFLFSGWILLVGLYGMVTSRDLEHTVGCLSVAQSATYVLLLAIGYREGATAPVRADTSVHAPVVDPVVQALALTDVVVGATVTALLLALVVQIGKRHHTTDPDELGELRG